MKHFITIRKSWIGCAAGLLTAVFLISACSDPISPVSDFDFEFDEFEDIGVDVELDTSTVDVAMETDVEDTTYIEQQSNFTTAISAGASSGQVPPALTDATEQATEAIDEQSEEGLNSVADQAEEDPIGFAEELTQQLEDPESSASQLAATVTDAAAQQAALASLLGVSLPPGGKGFGATESADYLPTPGGVGGVTEFAIFDCAEDARAQFATALQKLQENAARQEEVAQRTFQRSVDNAESVRTDSIAAARTRRDARVARANAVFAIMRAAITDFRAAGSIDDAQAADMRTLNALIFIVNLDKAAKRFTERRAVVNAAVDAAIAQSAQKRDDQLQQVGQGLQTAIAALEAARDRALARCHDQGETTDI